MQQTNPHKVAATGQEKGSGGVDSNDGGVEVEETLGGDTGNAEEVKGGTLGEEFDDFVEEEVVDEPPKGVGGMRGDLRRVSV